MDFSIIKVVEASIVFLSYGYTLAFPTVSAGKELPADEGDARARSSIPGSGRSPGKGNGNPLQYSCLGNRMDRGAWRATVHGVTRVRNDLGGVHTHLGISDLFVTSHLYWSLYKVTFVFLAVLSLHCCVQAFPSVASRTYSINCGAWASHCHDFSCGAPALGQSGLGSCGPQASLPHGMWNLPGPGIEPVSSPVAGRFLTTGPPGKSPKSNFFPEISLYLEKQ